MPVVYETLKSAVRSCIGERGLYVTSLTMLPNGDLLASPHYGSQQLHRVSIWRSTDQGRSWQQVQTHGDELFGAGALLKCLRDGTVLLHTGALYRSTDAGVTWRRVECPVSASIRSIVERPDGTLHLFDSDASWYAGHQPPPRSLLGISDEWYRETNQGALAVRSTWRTTSTDGAQSWSEPEPIISDEIYIGGETNWPDLQPFFREACVLQLTGGCLLAATRRNDPVEHMVLTESETGLEWTEPREFLGAGEIHAHLLELSDGRLLCTYVRQEVPRGVFAILSSDQGRTWDTDHPVQLATSIANSFGWPTSVQMPDGTITTSYTFKGYEETTQVNDSLTAVVRWQLPGDSERAEMEPLSEPFFPHEHNYPIYCNGITGFTGRSMQQVAYWELSDAERCQIPGYKGTLSRFPDGELLACPSPTIDGEIGSVIYRSNDEGRTWQKVDMQPDSLPGKEQAMLCLRDGKTVLLQTEASDEVLYRSTDRGITWQRIEYGHSMLTTRNFIQQSDGSILKFGSTGIRGHKQDAPRATAWRLRSYDGGLTWPECEKVAVWDSSHNFFGEVYILPFSDTHFLAATRITGDAARAIAGAPPIGVGGGAGGETDEGMVLMESHDAGLHWSAPRWMDLGYSAVHVHLLKLADGRILCVYRRRFLPFGVAAVLSEDNGKTWDTQHPIILGTRPTAYGGWPTSIELADGTILTTRAYMTWPGATFEAIRWQLPLPSEDYQGS